MTTENQGCEESPRTPEQIAKEYVDKQFAVMRKYGSLTKDISDREYFEIISKIADLIQPAATRETRGTAPRDFLNKWLGNEWTAEVTGEKLRINPEVFPPEKQIKVSIERICELLESYAAAGRVSQPVAPPPRILGTKVDDDKLSNIAEHLFVTKASAKVIYSYLVNIWTAAQDSLNAAQSSPGTHPTAGGRVNLEVSCRNLFSSNVHAPLR